jgi:hypothetical protein
MVRAISTVNGISWLLNKLFKGNPSRFELFFCREPNADTKLLFRLQRSEVILELTG